MRTLVYVLGALAALMVLAGSPVLVSTLRSAPIEPHGLRMPALAMEFMTAERVDAFLGPLGANGGPSLMRQNLRKGVTFDYGFIAVYWLLFAGMSLLLAQRGPRWALWAGVAAAVCATGTALFDVVENLRITAVLDAERATPDMVAAVAAACHGKWLLFSLTTLLLALLFARPDWLAALAALYAVVALLCLYGLCRDPRYVERAFLLSIVGLAALAVAFLASPDKFSGRAQGGGEVSSVPLSTENRSE
jgi:hypothetical protein